MLVKKQELLGHTFILLLDGVSHTHLENKQTDKTNNPCLITL